MLHNSIDLKQTPQFGESRSIEEKINSNYSMITISSHHSLKLRSLSYKITLEIILQFRLLLITDAERLRG
jgi:hypothetical protein